MTSMNDMLRLGGVLMERATHDLAGVVGALGGAIELAGDPDAAEIAAECALLLKRRLRLLRAMWHAAERPLAIHELRELLPALPGAGRVQFRLDRLSGGIAAQHVAISLAALVVAAEALPRGGSIELSDERSDELRIDVGGTRAAWPGKLSGMLTDPAAAYQARREAEPRDVAAGTLAAMAHRDGVEVRVAGETGLALRWA